MFNQNGIYSVTSGDLEEIVYADADNNQICSSEYEMKTDEYIKFRKPTSVKKVNEDYIVEKLLDAILVK